MNNNGYNMEPAFPQSGSAEMNFQMYQALQQSTALAKQTGSQSTRKTYDRLIAEFKTWCEAKFDVNDPTRYLVYGTKLNLFMTEVVTRKTKTSRKGKEPENLKFSAIEQYVSAITSLYREQVKLGANGHKEPRPFVKDLLKAHKCLEDNKKRQDNHDRASGTYCDGYTTTEELLQFSDYYFGLNTPEDLRNCLAFFLAHYLLLRGQNARSAELADIQMIHLQNEGPTKCPALVMVMHNGKTNKHGKTEITGCTRNKLVELCPIMMFSFYMFQRFHNEGEAIMNFTTSGDWFNVKVLKADRNPTVAWKYSSHYDAIKKAIDFLELSSTKVTHIGRGSGARMADLAGVGEDQIRRQGRWNNSSMNGAYLTGLPRESMRAAAGFPKEQGHFYLPRTILEPPVEIQHKIFPWADEWLGKITSGAAEKSNSAISFLNMLITFRVTILQDAVFMKLKYPHHPVFVNPLFDHELFIQFSSDLQAAVLENEGNNPVNMQLRTAVPLLDQRLETMQKKFDTENALRNNQMQEIMRQISDISTGRAPLNINVHIPGDGRQLPIVTTDFNPQNTPTISGDSSNSGSNSLILPAVNNRVRARPETTVVSYRFAKSLTLPILWCEWFTGLGGNYSIVEMNRLEPSWYKKDQKSYYDRRNRIIKRIKAYASQKFITDEAALHKAEKRREDFKYSLDFLGKNIRLLYEDYEE